LSLIYDQHKEPSLFQSLDTNITFFGYSLVIFYLFYLTAAVVKLVKWWGYIKPWLSLKHCKTQGRSWARDL